MKLLSMAVMAFLLFAGCASVTYDGDKFTYWRIGNQELINVNIEKMNSDGSYVAGSLERQISEENISELAQKVVEAMLQYYVTVVP